MVRVFEMPIGAQRVGGDGRVGDVMGGMVYLQGSGARVAA